MIAARSLAVRARQVTKAFSAATMAWWHSDGTRLATSAILSPVAGSTMSKRALPAIHSPLTRASVFSSVGSFSLARGEVFMAGGPAAMVMAP